MDDTAEAEGEARNLLTDPVRVRHENHINVPYQRLDLVSLCPPTQDEADDTPNCP